PIIPSVTCQRRKPTLASGGLSGVQLQSALRRRGGLGRGGLELLCEPGLQPGGLVRGDVAAGGSGGEDGLWGLERLAGLGRVAGGDRRGGLLALLLDGLRHGPVAVAALHVLAEALRRASCVGHGFESLLRVTSDR